MFVCLFVCFHVLCLTVAVHKKRGAQEHDCLTLLCFILSSGPWYTVFFFNLLHDILFVACAAKVVECCGSGLVINPFIFFCSDLIIRLHFVVRMWTWWLGAQTHIFFFQIHLKLTSTSTSTQTQFSSQSFQNHNHVKFKFISNSSHNHFKCNSDFESHSLQIQFLFSWASKNSQFKINFISSLLCTQGQNLLAGECTLLSQGQIGVLFHLSLVQIWYFTHVQIWYFMHVLSLVSSAGDEVPVLMWQCFRVLMFLLSALCPTKHHRNRHALMFNLTNL